MRAAASLLLLAGRLLHHPHLIADHVVKHGAWAGEKPSAAGHKHAHTEWCVHAHSPLFLLPLCAVCSCTVRCVLTRQSHLRGQGLHVWDGHDALDWKQRGRPASKCGVHYFVPGVRKVKDVHVHVRDRGGPPLLLLHHHANMHATAPPLPPSALPTCARVRDVRRGRAARRP